MLRCLCAAVLALLLLDGVLSSSANCDNFVRALGRRYRRIVRCSHGNLTRVPQLDRRSLRVNELLLDDNRIARLNDRSFHSWADIERLSVRNNRISRISVRAFRPLRRLQRLNLSGNQLHLPASLSPQTLAFVPEILELDLSFNPLRRLPSYHFQTLGFLQILHLRAVARPDLQLEPNAMFGLKALRTLDLTSNFLESLSEDVLGDLAGHRRLSSLLLGGANKWRCDCRLRWLKRRQLLQMPRPLKRTQAAEALVAVVRPRCEEPPVLQGRDLLALQADDFQCAPQMRRPRGSVSEPVSAQTGQNVSLVCSVSADPLDGLEWFKDRQLVRPASLGRSFLKSLSPRRQEEVEARLLLPLVSPADSGRWRCVAWNARGRATADFDLTVSPSCSTQQRPARVLGFIVMLAWGLLLLALAGLGLCYIHVRRQRRNKRLARLARRTLVKEQRPMSNVYLEEKL